MLHLKSCAQELTLRSCFHNGTTFIELNGHPLDNIVAPASPARCISRSASTSSTRTSSKNSSRSSSKTDDENRQLKGPERFFYDKGTYTGVHKNGGPTTKGKDGFPLQLRPSMHLGSTFTNVSGRPLDHDNVRSLGTTGAASFGERSSRRACSLGAIALLSCPAKAVERRSSSRSSSKSCNREITGPERFFYDKSSYTGVHKCGGPS